MNKSIHFNPKYINYRDDILGIIRNFNTSNGKTIKEHRNKYPSYDSNKYINSKDDLALKQSGINSEIKITGDDYKLKLFSSFLSSDKIDRSPQLRRPEKTYGFNFYKNLFGNLSMNLRYNHYGKHFDTHASSFATIEMDSTDIIDISFDKNFGMYNLQLNMTNLLDEKYQRPHGYSQNERLYNIKLKSMF